MKSFIKKFLTILILAVTIFSFTASRNSTVFAEETIEEPEQQEDTPILDEEDTKEIEDVLGDDDSLTGGLLYKSFIQFLARIGDIFIEYLQAAFLGNDFGDVKRGNRYAILYSPAQIFANKIPALDINFINPSNRELTYTETESPKIKNEDISEYEYKSIDKEHGEDTGFYRNEDKFKKVREAEAKYADLYGFDKTKNQKITSGSVFDSVTQQILGETILGVEKSATLYKSTKGENTYYILHVESTTDHGPTHTWREDYYVLTEGSSEVKKITKESTAEKLQGPIATWYKTLRAISLVGLLSVLLYIAIRIIISSTAAESAKYKKWLKNWVAAICLVFLIQFIMVGILEITQEITNVLGSKVIGDPNTINEDSLMTSIRNNIGDNPEKYSTFPELLIYLVLVIYTITFTIQYVKRVIYMAFLTMIAPLISLTYPLDKLKDGKAQAFDMWLKEYIYNSLLQVVHLLLYFMFVNSADTLVAENPIYALVAIGFLIPADKLIRRMFGFENKETTGAFEAAAGGALTMNAINKISSMAQSGGQGGSVQKEKENKKNDGQVRTVGGQYVLANSTAAWGDNKEPTQGVREKDKNNNPEQFDDQQIQRHGTPDDAVPPLSKDNSDNDNIDDTKFNMNGIDYTKFKQQPMTDSKGIVAQKHERKQDQNLDEEDKNTGAQRRKSDKSEFYLEPYIPSKDDRKTNNDMGFNSEDEIKLEENEIKDQQEDISKLKQELSDEDITTRDFGWQETDMSKLGRELNSPIVHNGIRQGSIIQGVKALNKKKKFTRKLAKGVAKLTLGGLGAITLGTVGLAAGISSGDLSKVATYAATGLTAGKKVGEGIVNKVENKAEKIKDDYKTFRQGYEGTEFQKLENERLDKKFKNDEKAISKYRANFRNYEKAMDIAVKFRQNGITDDDKIISAIKIGVEENVSIEKMINVAQHDKVISDSAYQKKEIRKNYTERLQSKIAKQLNSMNNPNDDPRVRAKNERAAQESANNMMILIARLKRYDI